MATTTNQMENVGCIDRLRDHYKHCIRLSASNKINPKNAFDLQLIDYMKDLVSSSEDGQMNFKIASSALDVGAKIYSNRVDCIQSEAQKVASSILMALDDDQQKANNADNANANGSQLDDSNASDRIDDSHEGGHNLNDEGNRRKRPKRLNKNIKVKTIVEDDTTLDGKLEKVVLGDPFLDGLSQDYDMSCPAALISYNVLTQPSCLLTIESSHLRADYKEAHSSSKLPSKAPCSLGNLETIIEEDGDGDIIMKDVSENRENPVEEQTVVANSATATSSASCSNAQTSEQYNLVSLISKNLNCAQIIRDNLDNQICPKLSSFLFNDRTTTISGFNSNTEEDAKQSQDRIFQQTNCTTGPCGGEHEFDPKLYGDNADYGDDHFGDADSVMDDAENRSLEKNDDDLLPDLDRIAATKPTEYGYSTEHHRLLNTWAGPYAWKAAKAPQGNRKDGLRSAKKRAKLQHEPIDFGVRHQKSFEEIGNEKIRHSSAVIRKWKKPLLPQDHNFEEETMRVNIIPRAYLKPEDTYHCMKTPADALKLVEKDHNYVDDEPQSPGFAGGFDDVHDDSDDEFRADPVVDGNEVAIYGAPINDSLTQQADLEFAGEHLIDQPYTVAQVNIPFAKIAKKMDVRKLKRAMWDLLLPLQSTNVTLVANVTAINGTTSVSGDDLNQPQRKSTNDKTSIDEIEPSISPVHLEFSNLYQELPDKISSKMANDLSKPIAFVTLLHLANERNLRLVSREDLKDFVIEQD